MRLEDDARKCVVYLGHESVGTDDEMEPFGTGFFVATDQANDVYLVTARHVVEGPESLKPPFTIRFNTKDGHGKNYHVDEVDWTYHPDPNVDFAVLPMVPPDWADVVVFPTKYFLSDFKLETKRIGAGDLAYVVGVFYLLHGTKKNLPFVHTGNIAMMPGDEPIPVMDWRYQGPEDRTIDIEGYVLQVETLPVSSGSPVFVRRSIETNTEDKDSVPLRAWVYGSVWFLGIWHGAWMAEPGTILAAMTPKGVTVPVGTGVVIPATKLIEVLDMPKLQQARDKAANDAKKGRAVSPQSAPPTKADNPQGREDFNSLLDAAVSKSKPNPETS